MNRLIEEKLKLLPDSPGVYRMLNSAGEIIYVGKAVNLKNRVRQYFHSQKNMSPKVKAMVSHIADFEYILTSNETEALTLEAAMTKSLQPHYNILLKDDKHFPYVRLDEKQDFPRFEVVRRARNDGARYFGPYLSAVTLRDALSCIRDIFPVRHCKKDIAKAIARRERPCLMHHLNKCCAPCSGKVTREEYHKLLQSVASFLEGDTEPVCAMLRQEMQRASDSMEYEKAAQYRDRADAVERMGEKQRAMVKTGAERDVFALARDKEDDAIFALFVRGGNVIGSQHYAMDSYGETGGSIMEAFLQQFYQDSGSIPKEVLVRDLPDNCGELEAWLRQQKGARVELHKPARGEKAEQVELAYKNGMDAIAKQRELEHRAWERGEGALARLCGYIGLEEIPGRIECFDNSHIMGRDTVSGMVVFINSKPAPKEYRRFRIKAQVNGDDLAAMKEALTRRFERAKSEDSRFTALPELLVIDGGRAQLDIALEVLNEQGLDFIPAIGLAERKEEIILPYQEQSVILPRGDGALHFLQRVRDEAHRFAISYHRSLHVRSALMSELDGIEGIGEKRKRLLFDAFITRDAIAAATLEQLMAVKGMNRPSAEAVHKHFHGGKSGRSDGVAGDNKDKEDQT